MSVESNLLFAPLSANSIAVPEEASRNPSISSPSANRRQQAFVERVEFLANWSEISDEVQRTATIFGCGLKLRHGFIGTYCDLNNTYSIWLIKEKVPKYAPMRS
ncbi:hypothetical protein CROQUDRAFT_104680 [Cronartium quercuum f. sp. fusiforme G11]|uniref:Uncharacterized protein n=1 Tax=Cronartium quercuum f. sp. fusiforme G11 TaxID=708437 RepID=A0A9P6NTI3_9BASI|nr:hypothetical protein CROQUDRAFT_88507 [Cronartium quercuum f. sp. fusiforme G11]KAG0149963.1 hypothetical protein CROQUDRAFT_104680 [Cronartium quercuum f. sp. fusiforme G11]